MATLNDDELQALMSAIQDGQVTPPSSPSRGAASATAFDLTSRDRIVRGEMPGLDAIHERAAKLFGVGLAGHTRLDLRISSGAASLVRFADLHPAFSPPSTVCILSLGKSGEQGVLIFEDGIADLLLMAALGDRKVKPGEKPPADAPRRALTGVDRVVLRKLVTILCEALELAWRDLLPVEPAVMRFEEDPRLCMIAAPNDLAVSVPFELSGHLSGQIRLAFPYSLVEPVRRQLSSPPRAASPGDARFQRHIAGELDRVEVHLAALLGRATVRIEKLLALDVGDVLVLDTSELDPLPVLVEGRAKMLADPTTSGSSIAVRIRDMISATPNEPPSA